MGKLEEAVRRLERAVARLEQAATQAGAEEKAQGTALAAAKADYRALVETTQSVSRRLDAAILRLDRALEG